MESNDKQFVDMALQLARLDISDAVYYYLRDLTGQVVWQDEPAKAACKSFGRLCINPRPIRCGKNDRLPVFVSSGSTSANSEVDV
jgi:hypothetical protein